jgi:hypothetical protein
MEINENKTLDSFTGIVYCLGVYVSGDTVRGGDASSLHACIDTLPHIRLDPFPLAAGSRRPDANYK